MEHLCIFHCDFPGEEICHEVGNNILFEFSSRFCEILECGVRVLSKEVGRSSNGSKKTEEKDDLSYEFKPGEVLEESAHSQWSNGLICDSKSDNASNEEEDTVEGKEHTNCWSCLCIFIDLSNTLRNIGTRRQNPERSC